MSLLGDDIARALPELRAQALSCMVDSGHVETITGSSDDPSTHQRINTWTPSWTGPMQVRVTSIEQMVLAGGQEVAVVRAMVFIGSVLYIVGLILTDISYTLVDPRIRFDR